MKTKIVLTLQGVAEVEEYDHPYATEDEDGFVDNGYQFKNRVIRYLDFDEIRELRAKGEIV